MLESWLTSQWQKRGWVAYLLLPLSWLYRGVATLNKKRYQRRSQSSYRAPVPVIVVGNIYVGGTGKTPVILSLIEALRARGWHPGLVSRGYGSTQKDAPACGTGSLDANIFGGEPAMISHKTQIPISVYSKRADACQALLQFDPAIDVILSDDGLQHWALERDIELLVQDERGCGNGFVLPAGPLRESAHRLTEVDAILTRSKATQFLTTDHASKILRTRFTVQVHHFVHLQTGKILTATAFVEQLTRTEHTHPKPNESVTPHPALPIVAMAGIGVPERFFHDLRMLGIALQRTIALGDHRPIAPSWITSLPEHTILMTEKDAARLTHAYSEPADSRIWVGVAATRWQDEVLFDWLDQRLRQLPKKLNQHAMDQDRTSRT